MSDNVFDGHILAEKLSKLNSSQQSIESLSRWCISHRKRARQIVETWDKASSAAQREQRISFLYLANDILQNSRRKGSEFVNEFWKVLPAALKNVYESDDDLGKKAACRLVDIWEERKVFGSRGQNLKDEILGKDPPPPPPPVSNGKSSNPIKIVKRDAHSLRIKLAVGAMPEKIVTAFQSVHDENVTEEAALNKCKAAASLVGKMEKDVESTSAHGDQQGSILVDEIQEQENVLKECVRQLENAEATRSALVSQLKEAVQEQELKLELICTQLQVARGQIEQMSNMKQRLTSPPIPASLNMTNQPIESSIKVEPNLPLVHPSSSPLAPPVMSFAAQRTSEEENKRATAAAVAAKLTASTSSAQMLTSVLSSLVAEEAASVSGGLKSAGFISNLPMFSPEKRMKLDKPMSSADANNSEIGNTSYFTSLQQQPMGTMPLVPPTSIQPMNPMQSPFPPPPPPPVPPANSPANQFVQSASMMMGIMPYGYGGNSLPPPPPLPSHIAMGLARPAPQPQQPQQMQSQQQQQSPQPPTNGGYYRPPGIGFYGQSHQPTTQPVPRQ
ncbi:Regulation of nuclear pre-mRNA domain-containing protein 1B [Camellia lanceoleosa]|uniref:Regulation of nuclear pre-mRNA domain-containing protein 1B n=1 Tax=Camellia lanceoleosa TaxID=1840588 RepID=A0ACC0FVJ3_9ERIC|nr:Regulation of nuclear pre-mRNA domain-containing protein 1B [Camellia lanceoleosa]